MTSPLTLREVTILDRLARGFNYDAIAKEQAVGVATLDVYIRIIKTKLAAKTTTQAVAFAVYKRWIHPFELPLGNGGINK